MCAWPLSTHSVELNRDWVPRHVTLGVDVCWPVHAPTLAVALSAEVLWATDCGATEVTLKLSQRPA